MKYKQIFNNEKGYLASLNIINDTNKSQLCKLFEIGDSAIY